MLLLLQSLKIDYIFFRFFLFNVVFEGLSVCLSDRSFNAAEQIPPNASKVLLSLGGNFFREAAFEKHMYAVWEELYMLLMCIVK